MADRTIAGVVDAQGNIVAGSEFSVTRSSQGHYVVSFRPGFSKLGGASVTEVYPEDGDTRDNAVIIKLSETDLYLKTGGSGGDAKDRGFTFVACGTGSVKVS